MSTNEEQLERSLIIIEFAHLGAADPNISVNNITPAQVICAAEILKMMGQDELRAMRLKQQAQQAELLQMQQVIAKGKKKH